MRNYISYQRIDILELHDPVLDEEGGDGVEAAGRHLPLLVVGAEVETELKAKQLTHSACIGQKLP